ncbi:MAG: corrinoid protein [Bifidobacteriaceae bacterium]|jgi:methylmalonyl-CoA mutase cobalamin-binding domain/chain|nr:corrinoid protein [Bifidobacteriaceae bacterium]
MSVESVLELIATQTAAGKATRKGDQDGVDELVAQALADGAAPSDVLDALVKGMGVVGDQFAAGKAFVPNMLLAARAMSKGMAHLKPYFSSGEVKRKGTFVVGTVFGDLHDIGKNLVAMTVEGNGWEVIDLGVDVKPEAFAAAVAEHPGAVVGLSALLTTTMVNMEKIIQTVRAAHPDTKVIVGGAPITQGFADQIGASGYAPNPAGAVELLASLAA